MNKSCHIDDLKTQTTLPPSRKFFQRQSHPSTSLSTSRRSLSNRKLPTSQVSLPFIRMNCNTQQDMSKPYKLNFGDKTRQKAGFGSVKGLTGQFITKVGNNDVVNKEKELASKVEELLEETIMRQDELNEMTVEKETLCLELEGLRTRVKMLEEANTELRKSEYQLKDTLKKLTKERNSLQNEKFILTKKVSQLEKGIFPSKPPSIQNMKQLYLEKELIELRHRFTKQRSSNQKQLQQEIVDLRQKLFNSTKLLDSLHISNQCLLRKNETIVKELRSTPELMGLRSKYKKTLGERDQLKKVKEMSRKQIENLLMENNSLIRELERLKTLPLSTGDESLDFSIVSHFSEKG